MKKVLLTRFGGIGDSAPIGVVGAQLKKRGYHVTAALRDDGKESRLTDLYQGNPCFDELLDWAEIGPWGNRCVKTQFGFCSIENLYQDFDLVLDFMNIIEGNNTSPIKADGPGNVWQGSRNSNWVNWMDLHLAWANIDPTSVPDDEKRPQYFVDDMEKENILSLKKKYGRLVTIQTSASSISRSWFQAKELPDKIIKAYPDVMVAYWEQGVRAWVLVTKDGATRLEIKSDSALRASMSLIACSDLYIGADTGFSHIAEGLGVKNIAVYSTVPAWTRNKYYKHQITVDHGKDNPEFYTFNLGLGDPLRTIDGLAGLTEREKLVQDLRSKKSTAKEAAAALNTDEEGATLELESLLRKQASFERQQSKSLSSVSADEVFALIQEVLK